MAVLSTKEHPLTVTSLTQEIKSLLERNLVKVFVEAEISGWHVHSSGHVYFTLKDAGAQISAVMFKSSFERYRGNPALKDGAKVIVYGNVTVYPPKGGYQLQALAIKPMGEGDLMQRYLALKARLEAEGLFAPTRKRPLPSLPRRIGLVTSPSGAVVHDMCRVMMRRFPAVEIRLFPAVVQGDDAPSAVVAGLDYFNGLIGSSWTPDLVIVARGGGSFEDLFCFNDERLVRAVAASSIPVISAVGHETDFTLCDFAADVRAGTPSIAAELAVPVLADLRRKLTANEATLTAALRSKYEWFAQRVDMLSDALGHALWRYESTVRQSVESLAGRFRLAGAGLRATCELKRQQLERWSEALASCLRLRLVASEARLTELQSKLSLLSPYSVLDRGYSLTTDAAGAVITDVGAVAPGTVIHTRLRNGELVSTVSSAAADAPAQPPPLSVESLI